MEQKYKSVSEFIKGKIRFIEDDAQSYHTLRVRTWVKNWAFYRGNHFADWDRQGNWVQLPDTQTEDLRYTDDFYYYVETKATQWSQSNPELAFEPVSDLPQVRAAIRHVEKELGPYKQRYWHSDFKQALSKFAMLSTSYFIHTRPMVSGASKVTKFMENPVSGDGMFLCANCGASGPEKDLASKVDESGKLESKPVCPECGKANLAIKRSITVVGYAPNGVESVPDIDIDVELVDPMEIKIDSKCRAANVKSADFLRRERYIRDYEVREIYPDFDKIMDEKADAPQTSNILDYKRGLEQSTGGLSFDYAKDSHTKLRRQYWLDLKVYRTFKPDRDEEYAGMSFKKDIPLGDIFPNGLYIDQIDGKIVKFFNEDKNDTWVGGVDTVDPTSPYGRGFSGLVNLQEMIDEGVSLSFAYLMRDALGLQIYDPLMVEASDVQSARVGGAIPLKPGAQIDGRPISAALINVDTKPLSPFTLPFLQMIDSKMPHAAGGAFDILGGGAGVGAGRETLGGQTQQLNQAAGMIGPSLKIRAQVEVEAFFQYLEYLQKYGSDKHFRMLAGEWGQRDVEAFKNCNLREDIHIYPVDNSEIPRTQFERKQDVAIAIQSGLANPTAPILDGVRQYGLEQLRIPLENDPAEQARRVGETLLGKMRQAAVYVSSFAGEEINTEELAMAVSAVAQLSKARDEGSLPVYKQIFQEYLRSTIDEPVPDMLMIAAAELKLSEIEMLEFQMVQDNNAKAAMAQAPMAMAQAQLEAATQPDEQDAGEAARAQAEAQTQQKQAEAQLDVTKEQASAGVQAMQTALEQEENERQRKHDLEIEAIRGRNAQYKTRKAK